MKIVFNFQTSEVNEDIIFINSLAELFDELGYDIYVDSLPCYAGWVRGIGFEPNNIDIHDVVQGLCEWGESEMYCLSVTSAEPRYQDWLDATAGIPGATHAFITRQRGTNTTYDCCFICLPTHLNIWE